LWLVAGHGLSIPVSAHVILEFGKQNGNAAGNRAFLGKRLSKEKKGHLAVVEDAPPELYRGARPRKPGVSAIG